MEHELTPEKQIAVTRMSEDVARRRNLDEEGRREIEGHIEDKVMAYLRAEVTLTEDDALLLAQEHFGKDD